MAKVIVFDLGGTLMEFKGMPPVWIDYYKVGFDSVNAKYNLGLTDSDIDRSVQIMKSFNPRVNYRENEIAPYDIFKKATADWNKELDINSMIESFFAGINLETVIYDYSFKLLEKYKSNGYKIACLTDLPSGMPDYIFRKPLAELIDKLDLYVSSQSCGYRKPNKFGLQYIADYFNTDIKDIMFIGDEEKDKQAAQNASCKFMFITKLLEKV
ncbi:MAG: HAD family hydrolase [Eubacterium sp.]